MSQRLVLVQPVGGYTQVLRLAADATKFNFLGTQASISVILDKDIKIIAGKFIEENRIHLSNKANYLPIESLEKYLRNKLYSNTDRVLWQKLNSFIFKVKGLNDILHDYDISEKTLDENKKDKNGKRLFNLLLEEMKARNVSKGELITIIVDHLFEYEKENINVMVETLTNQLIRK